MYATPNYDSWLYEGSGGPHDDTPDMIETENDEPQESEEA